jgi:hypothetical protein
MQENEVHQAAEMSGSIKDQIGFQEICTSNPILCNKIDFEGTYTDKQKYLYLGNIFKVTNHIDDNLNTQQKVGNTIDIIELNKTIGDRR